MLAILVSLIRFIVSWVSQSSNKCLRLVNWLDHQLKWNFFFTFLFAGQIELFTSILIQLKTWDWDGASDGDKAAIISSVVMIGFLIIATVFLVQILRVARAKELFKEKPYLRRFGAITEDLKSKTKMHLSFQFVMTARRLILAMLVVYDHLTA